MGEPYLAEPVEEMNDSIVHRNSIGGHPILPKDQSWPICPTSGKKMVLYLQFDLDEAFGLFPFTNHHLSIFQSPVIDTIPRYKFMPNRFPPPLGATTKYDTFTCAFLHERSPSENVLECDSVLRHFNLSFKRLGTSFKVHGLPVHYIIVGGHPFWIQDPEPPQLPMKANASFICQIAEDFPFLKRPEAPIQADSKSESEYELFVGNQVYLFGCLFIDGTCSVWATAQS